MTTFIQIVTGILVFGGFFFVLFGLIKDIKKLIKNRKSKKNDINVDDDSTKINK